MTQTSIQTSAQARRSPVVESTNKPDKSELPLFPLENGDRLSRAEFQRRYQHQFKDQLEYRKIELIEGIVYMAAAAAALRFHSHGKPHSHLNNWLSTYRAYTPGTEIADTASVQLDNDNEPQPDLILIWDPEYGGQTHITEDDYVVGAPELIAEISASTVSIDLGTKKTAYERNGVKEYLVWRVLDREIDWFYLEDDRYILLEADADGILRSRIFPGLWLDRSAILEGNLKRMLEVLHEGIYDRDSTSLDSSD
jgi:Putative restriction endonuclease